MDTWRNRLAWRICSWTLRWVAEGDYPRIISGAIRYGMEAAAKDTKEARGD